MEIDVRTLKLISAAKAIIGLILGVVLLPEEKSLLVNEISEKHLGEKVITFGQIKELNISEGNAFFEIENEARIKAVYFKPSIEQMASLRENALVKARGKIVLYKGELEIIIQEVKRID